MRADLRQEAFGEALRRLAEKHGVKPQPAPDRFLDNPQTLDGTVTAFGPLGAREGLPQFFHERIVPAFYSAKPLRGGRAMRSSGHLLLGKPRRVLESKNQTSYRRPVAVLRGSERLLPYYDSFRRSILICLTVTEGAPCAPKS